ncbi:MAG: glycyl-tRNA synthetase (class II), partial [Salibacteraceae bacterium]
RDRDTMKQTRVSVSELKQILSEKTSMAELVKGAL